MHPQFQRLRSKPPRRHQAVAACCTVKFIYVVAVIYTFLRDVVKVEVVFRTPTARNRGIAPNCALYCQSAPFRLNVLIKFNSTVNRSILEASLGPVQGLGFFQIPGRAGVVLLEHFYLDILSFPLLHQDALRANGRAARFTFISVDSSNAGFSASLPGMH